MGRLHSRAFSPGGDQGWAPQGEKQMESMSQIRPVPINCLTCAVFTILLVTIVVALGALSHPRSHPWFQSPLVSVTAVTRERRLQPTPGIITACLVKASSQLSSKLRKPLSTMAGTLGKSRGVLALRNSP